MYEFDCDCTGGSINPPDDAQAFMVKSTLKNMYSSWRGGRGIRVEQMTGDQKALTDLRPVSDR